TAIAALRGGAVDSKPGGSAEGATGTQNESGERDARLVRATYLGIRRADIEVGGIAASDAPTWLIDALKWAGRIRAIDLEPDISAELSTPKARGPASILPSPMPPLGADGIARWLTALVGSPAARWPMATIAGASEATLADRLTDLAQRIPPRAWTFVDV